MSRVAQAFERLGYLRPRDALLELGHLLGDFVVARERIALPGTGEPIIVVEALGELVGRRSAELGPVLEQIAELTDESVDRRGHVAKVTAALPITFTPERARV